jgi:hypothetical protein
MRTLIFLLQNLIGFPVGSAFVRVNPGAPTPEFLGHRRSSTLHYQHGNRGRRATTGSVVGR